MATQLEFLTPEIVAKASKRGWAAEDVRLVMDQLCAIMCWPEDGAAREMFLRDAEIQKALQKIDKPGKRLGAADAVRLRELLSLQRGFPIGVPELEQRLGRAYANGLARGLLFIETLRLGNASKAKAAIVERTRPGYDKNFERNLHLVPLAHLWAAVSHLRAMEVEGGGDKRGAYPYPCRPERLADLLGIARAYQSELPEKAGAGFRIPADWKLPQYRVQPIGEARPKMSRISPRHLVPGEVRV